MKVFLRKVVVTDSTLLLISRPQKELPLLHMKNFDLQKKLCLQSFLLANFSKMCLVQKKKLESLVSRAVTLLSLKAFASHRGPPRGFGGNMVNLNCGTREQRQNILTIFRADQL